MSSVCTPFLLVMEDCDEDFDTVLTGARNAEVKYQIRRANNGDECLRILDDCERNHCPNPALVILDLNTPNCDGRDALLRIRNNERFRTIPLIILTTSGNPRDVDFCCRNGANAYHTKPVDYLDHLNTLHSIFTYWMTSAVLPP